MSTVALVSAGLSSPSSSRVLGDELAAAVARRTAAEVTVVELRELAHALVDSLLTGFPSPELKRAIDVVVGADAVIAVTPVFTASYSALFKAFFDVLDKDALVGHPVLIAATGGTERHSLALEHVVRPLFGYLRAHVAPTAVYAASADFGAQGGDRAGLAARIERAADELATLMTALPHRAPVDEFADPVPFDDLLSGRGATRA